MVPTGYGYGYSQSRMTWDSQASPWWDHNGTLSNPMLNMHHGLQSSRPRGKQHEWSRRLLCATCIVCTELSDAVVISG